MYSKTIEQILYADVFVIDHYKNGPKRYLHNLTHKDKIPKHYIRMTKIDEKDPTYKYWNDNLAKSGEKADKILLHRHLKQAYDRNGNPVKPTIKNLDDESRAIDGGKNIVGATHSKDKLYKYGIPKSIIKGKHGEVSYGNPKK
jgi:hypothetical protein